MRICLLCNEYPPGNHGGIGTFTRGIARGMTALGHQVWVAGVYPNVSSLVEEDDEGANVQRLPTTPGGGRRAFFADRIRLARFIQSLVLRESIGVVEAPENGGWSSALRVPAVRVVRIHSSHFLLTGNCRKQRGRLIALAERFALRRATHLAAVSERIGEGARRYYRGSGIRRRAIPVIHNGVDTGLFRRRDYSERSVGKIVFAGTLKPQKGVVHLLAAFQSVAAEDPSARLALAGRDTVVAGKSYRKVAICEAGITDETLNRIDWLGHVPSEELPSLYASASVCVFPSLAESFGLVVAEAMACCRPVVYTDTAVGRELIEDGEDGRLVPPSDPHILAGTIRDLLSQPEFAAGLGRNAASKVEREFSLDRCVELTLDLYWEALGAGIGSARGRAVGGCSAG